MNKDEFLRQLEVLLSGISQEERTEALAFYRSYFEDAGEANEAKILEELESPQKVADSIIKDLGVQPGKRVLPARREHRQEQSGIRQCRAHRREQQQEQSGIRQCREQRRTHRREYHREQRRMQRILRRRRMECRDGRSFFWSSLRRCGW